VTQWNCTSDFRKSCRFADNFSPHILSYLNLYYFSQQSNQRALAVKSGSLALNSFGKWRFLLQDQACDRHPLILCCVNHKNIASQTFLYSNFSIVFVLQSSIWGSMMAPVVTPVPLLVNNCNLPNIWFGCIPPPLDLPLSSLLKWNVG
jgi:hypothetical protein